MRDSARIEPLQVQFGDRDGTATLAALKTLIEAMPGARIVSSDGAQIYSRDELDQGRQVWQSIGGQELGSIWGHGALVARRRGALSGHQGTEATGARLRRPRP